MYGANTGYHSGITTYVWKDNIGPYLDPVVLDGTKKAWTIWDAGGSDIIDISTNTYGCKLDLRGGVDDKGTATLTDDVVRFSEVGDERIAIALDPASGWTKPIEIENAKGGHAANDNHPRFHAKIAC